MRSYLLAFACSTILAFSTRIPASELECKNFKRALELSPDNLLAYEDQINNFYSVSSFKLDKSGVNYGPYHLGNLVPFGEAVQKSEENRNAKFEEMKKKGEKLMELEYTFFVKDSPNYFVNVKKFDMKLLMEPYLGELKKQRGSDPLVGRAADYLKLIYNEEARGTVGIVLGKRPDNSWCTPGGFFSLNDLTNGKPDFSKTAKREFGEEIKFRGVVLGKFNKIDKEPEFIDIAYNSIRDTRYMDTTSITYYESKTMASTYFAQRFSYGGEWKTMEFRGADDLIAAQLLIIDLSKDVESQLPQGPWAFDHKDYVIKILKMEQIISSKRVNKA